MFRQSKSSVAALDSADSAVKASLILRLKECVSEIVMKHTAASWVSLKNEDATNMLCWILEAVFIHGLKNTFIKSLFTSRRENAIPNPSFWDFVMIFSHRDVIEQIRKLNYVNSDVGRSRAWIRITLNEMSLVSYLENMFRNQTYVRSFYKPSAFLRDSEKCDILKNYLVGVVESCKFELVVDNSLLNQWTSGPLSLVGLWMDDNISQGIDVASNMDSEDLQTIPQLGKVKNPVPEFVTALRRQPLLAEEDALRIIMASKPSSSSNASSRRNSDASQSGATAHGKESPMIVGSYSGSGGYGSKRIADSVLSTQDQSAFSTVSKSNSRKELSLADIKQNELQHKIVTTTSTSKRSETVQHANTSSEKVVQESKVILDVTPEEPIIPSSKIILDSDARSSSNVENEELSYLDLLAAYNNEKKIGAEIYSGSSMETTTDNDGLESSDITTSFTDSQRLKQQDGWQIIFTYDANNHSPEMYSQITEFVGKIANEVGMDIQQYSCKCCSAPIGMSIAIARVCHFTGNYFCSNCHLLDMNVIPSRILLNWDFTLYSVCRLSHDFIQMVKDQPLFDLERINSKLYTFIDELSELRDLRTKLYYVSMYLQTCKDETAFEEFKKEMCSREYIYEKIHLYSLSDLLSVTNRALSAPLTKLLKSGKSHIISCKICKAKGFVCEICKNPEVIFPFNLESIFKCRSCGAVYHAKCMNPSKPCPRCQRWKNIPQDKYICDDDS